MGMGMGMGIPESRLLLALGLVPPHGATAFDSPKAPMERGPVRKEDLNYRRIPISGSQEVQGQYGDDMIGRRIYAQAGGRQG